MRKIALVCLIVLLASAGALESTAQKAAAGSTQRKVVIVVGAVEGLTGQYRADANAAAAAAAKWTSNVVKVYSPNATWAAVQAAADGASLLIYMGHGNGYPSPYVGYLQTAKDDGMGLNASAAGTDNNKQYYGEAYMAELNLAPNAVVILSHLCYASGNSESGRGLPTLAVAHTRVDNFASGFLRGNARAVIAEGLGSIDQYIEDILSTHQTIDRIWKSAPTFHNHVTNWGSTRSLGFTSQIDPDTSHPQRDGDIYYRSMVSLPGLSSDDVGVGVTYEPTTYHPVTPTRLLDTRKANGLSGKFSANVPRTFQVTGRDPIPDGATAVTGNLTVTEPSGGYAVYLGPTPIASPSTSTINFLGGETLANGVTVALSSTGSLSATYMSGAGNTLHLVFDVTGYFAPGTSGDTYHPMTPVRLVDSRLHKGIASRLVANQARPFAVRGVGVVPDAAVAVTGNVTVTGSTGGWAIYVGPDPIDKPLASTLNFTAGQVRANSLTVRLSGTGTLAATFMGTDGATTDVVIDITGYYTVEATGMRYVPVTPVRMLDSRYAVGLGSKLPANTPRAFTVRGRCGIPAGATGVSANVTVVNTSHPWAVFVGPNSVAKPPTSTINFTTGQIRANGMTVALSPTGTLSATYMASPGYATDLVLDVTGYFAP